MRRATPLQRLPRLQAVRSYLHRLQPSRPLGTVRAAAAFVRERRIVLTTGRSSLPMLAEAIAGAPITGSWMAHPAVYRIHKILEGLRKYDLVSAPLILGKETLFDPVLGPAVETLAADPKRRAARRALLPPVARRLLREVEHKGRIRMDHWDGPYREARRARLLLARLLMVASREMHTERGYHSAIVIPWADADFSRRFSREAAGLTLAEAADRILLAAVRSAVLAPVREVKRWLVTGAERVEVLVKEGKLARLAAPGGHWLTHPETVRSGQIRRVK